MSAIASTNRGVAASRRYTGLVLAMLVVPAVAAAQSSLAEPPLHRVEAAFSAGWLAGTTLGAADANLRTRTGNDYLLFSTDSRFGGAPMLEARASYALTRRYTVEARAGFSRPELRTTISGDVEGAPGIDVTERIDQYTFEGALIVMLPGLRFASLEPFASGGAGYLRQLHEGQTLVEEGVVYHVGGGVKHALFARQQGLLKAAGFRGDLRWYVLTGGIDLDAGSRQHLAAIGGFFVTF
jgi:hypothetical protein